MFTAACGSTNETTLSVWCPHSLPSHGWPRRRRRPDALTAAGRSINFVSKSISDRTDTDGCPASANIVSRSEYDRLNAVKHEGLTMRDDHCALLSVVEPGTFFYCHAMLPALAQILFIDFHHTQSELPSQIFGFLWEFLRSLFCVCVCGFFPLIFTYCVFTLTRIVSVFYCVYVVVLCLLLRRNKWNSLNKNNTSSLMTPVQHYIIMSRIILSFDTNITRKTLSLT